MLAHRWVGLSLAGFLVMAGLTGSVLAFDEPLDAALNPDLFGGGGGPALPITALIAAVEAADPGLVVTRVMLPDAARRSVLLGVAAAPGAPDEVFVDAASGRILGRRNSAGCCLRPTVLMPSILRLHETLLLGTPGRLLMGAVGLLWTADCCVGLLLTLPRARPLLTRWRAAWSVKRTTRPFRLVFDLHRAGGLWCWGALLTVAVSGTALTLYSELFFPAVSALLPTTVRPTPAPSALPPIGLDRAIDLAAQAWPREQRLWAYRAGSTVVVASRSDGHAAEFGLGPDETRFDPGAAPTRHDASDGRIGDWMLHAQYPLHSGQIAGLAGRVAVCALGLAVAGLAASGVWLWWRKRAARRPAWSPRRPHSLSRSTNP